MDRVSFTIWAVVGKIIALVAFFSLGDKRRARIPPIVWWLCLTLRMLARMGHGYGLRLGLRSVASVFWALDTEKMTPSPRRIRRRMTCNPKPLISTDETGRFHQQPGKARPGKSSW